jgi:hypothetical protein
LRTIANWVAAVFAILLITAQRAPAAPVAADTAVKAVHGWLKKDGHPFGKALSSNIKRAETISDANGQPVYFVLHLKPAGFVIVSADDTEEPVVAFSSSGDFDSKSKSPLATLVNRDLPQRHKRSRKLAGAPSPRAKKAQAKWNAFLASSFNNPPPDSEENYSITTPSQIWVSPFIQTLWNQQADISLDYAVYNYYTPPGPPGNINNDVCGCVATCLAELMYYYRYPTAGVGTNSFQIQVNGFYENDTLRGGDGGGGPYQWNSMPLAPYYPTSQQAQAIGALTHDAATAVKMMYTADDSSAYTSDAQRALTNTFMYANAEYFEDDVNGISGTDLATMINPNIDARLPVVLGIYGDAAGGHCLLADGYGYSASTLFHHLNTGWGGDDDIWYALPTIDTADNGAFTLLDSVIYNVYTNGTGQIISGRVTDPAGNPVSGATVTATGNGGPFTTTADGNGIYALIKIPASSSYTVTATASGYSTNQGTFVTGHYVYDSAHSPNVWSANFVLAQPLLAIPETGFTTIGPTNGPFSVSFTNYVLTNTTSSAVNWVIGNSNNWLTVSPTSGNLPAGDATNFTVSLNSAANALSAGTHSGSVWVTNLTSGTAQRLFFSITVETADYPVAVTGYNMDVITESNAIGGDTTNYADAFGTPDNLFSSPVCFYESGLVAYNFEIGNSPSTLGLPPNGLFTSVSDNATTFQFGPYTSSNVLYVTGAPGSFTLTTPAAYKSLSILAASAVSGGSGTMVLNFANGSSSSPIAFNAGSFTDTGNSNTAITKFGVLTIGNYNLFGTIEDPDFYPSLYQTTINLHARGLDTNIIDSVTFTPPNGAATGIFALSGTESGNYSVMVSSSPSDGGTVSGGGVFNFDSTNTVTATASSGSTFLNWTLNGVAVSTATNYTFVVTNNVSLVANFRTLETISVTASPSNDGTVSGGATNAEGSTNTVMATANSGFAFVDWTVNGTIVSTSSNYSFTLSSNTALVANFLPTFSITVNSAQPGEGSVSGDANNAEGSTNTVWAAADDNFAFTTWTVNGVTVSASPEYTFVLSSNTTLVANFSPSFVVVANALPDVGGMAGGSGTFGSNTTVVVTATASPGYVFTNWTIDSAVVSVSTNYSFTLLSNTFLTANFAAAPPQIGVLNGTNVIANNQTNAVSFGSPGLGQQGDEISFTVTNFGGEPLVLSNISVPPGFALITNAPSTLTSFPASIAGLSNGTFAVQLLTSAFGNYSGNVVISNNGASNGVFSFPISGSVAGTVSITTAALPLYGGTVIGGGSIPAGATDMLTAVPNSGFVFTGWTIDATGTNNPLNIVASTNMVIAANFAATASGITVAVSTSGTGSVTPDENGKTFKAGSSFTLKATPGAGQLFSNWTGSITSTKNPLTVTKIQSSIVLQANFVPNPFTPFVGAYNGLFTAASGVAENSAGMLKNLLVTSKGTYSGSLLFDGMTKGISGSFNLAGQASNSITLNKTLGNVALTMAFTQNNSAPQVTGTVSGNGWLSTNLVANRSAQDSLIATAYTLLIAPDTNNAAAPDGSGYAVISATPGTSKADATAKIAGALADGTAFSQSVAVSQDGYVPVYVSLYAGKGVLLGWINLNPTNLPGVTLNWVHPAEKGTFTEPFTNYDAVEISPWSSSASSETLPTNLFLTGAVTNAFAISISSKGAITGTDGSNTLTGTLTLKTGLVKVTTGKGKAKTTATGVILYEQEAGGGFAPNGGNLILSR